MKKTIIVLITFVICTVAFAGNPKMKRAEKYYSAYAYKEAIRLYEELEVVSPADELIIKRLAECHRLVNNTIQAEKYYAKIVAGNNASPEDFYNYSMTLRANGKPDEADKWMEKFMEKKSADSRAKEFSSNKDKIEALKRIAENYTIRNAEINSPYSDFGPSFNTKGKILFASARTPELLIKHQFAWDETQYLDIYESYVNADFSLQEPALVTGEVNTNMHDGPATVTADGKTIYFTRNNYYNHKKGKSTDGVVKLKIYHAQLTEAGEWTQVKELTFCDKEYSVGHPCISKEGNRLYFSSDMPGSVGGTDIWYSDKDAAGNWGKPVNMGNEINTEGNEMFPFITSKGDLIFSSNGHFGFGGLDIFYAKLRDSKFDAPKNMGMGMNSNKDDFGLVCDATMKFGYFSSNRDGGKGDDDIYIVNFRKPFETPYYLKGIITDKVTGKIIPEAEVKITANGKEQVIKSNDKGEYSFEIQSKTQYVINCKLNNYFAFAKDISSQELTETNNTLQQNMELIKDEAFILAALVTDKKTGQPVSGVKAILVDNAGITTELTTDDNGGFKNTLKNKKPGDLLEYTIELVKVGYFPKKFNWRKQIEMPGEIKLNTDLDISLEKPDVGMDLAKIVNLNPIYFDVGKSNIRIDAATELDKIVKAMKEYPNMVVELGSHTDCRGDARSNLALSDRRAKSSAAYIVSKGIAAKRIYGKGYGEGKLKNNCACEGAVKSSCNDQEHQENRRTEFIITKLN